ncbi:MAG: hypothetical protein K2N72_05680 [Oscillospiraceae bacterium]|nr:hypothetical protein [Oscillospiraceae bacterium]
MSGNYDDIIDLPHHVSRTRTPMSMHDRAAQFSPFAALTGYEDCIDETARITCERLEITEDRAAMLNGRIAYLNEHAHERPAVIVEYFYPDETKQGGRYITTSGNFRRIDEAEDKMVLAGGEKIPMGDIYGIDIQEEK